MISYKNVDVWKISMETVNEVYSLTKLYPVEEKYGLISQTNRAAVSIPSNIAEGLGRNHKKDCIQFLHVSRGSAYELETLLSIALMRKIINDQCYNKISTILERNIQLITGFINYLKQKPYFIR
ncbi:MAG TPA: four helix bundle protein [Puia sp.]|jgi:four helix bundle protein|nr:four helix bundle protein [Puia sp.]